MKAGSRHIVPFLALLSACSFATVSVLSVVAFRDSSAVTGATF